MESGVISRRAGRWALGVIALLGAALWLSPNTPAREWPGFPQLVAVDRLLAVLLLTIAISCAVVGVVSRRHRELMILVVIVTVALSIAFGGRVLIQGASDGVAPRGDATLRAISWNAGDVDPAGVAAALAPYIEDRDSTVIVLPETGWKSGEIVARDLEDEGYANTVYAPESTATSLILPDALVRAGRYRMDTSSPPWAGLALIPTIPSFATPIIVATHLQQPQPDSIATWQQHVDWVAALCASSPYVIVVGDMNSTLNNLGSDAVGGCADVAFARQAGAAATWPTGPLTAVGVSIDRFMVGPGYDPAAATFQVLRGPEFLGSDHWPISGSF